MSGDGGDDCASSGACSLAEWRRRLSRAFAAAGLDTPDLDARSLICAICSLDAAQLILTGDRAASEVEGARLQATLERRVAGEPVSRILGVRQFWGLDFLISEATLDPRPDSETVIEAALDIVDREHWRCGRVGRALRILDIGTGTGCLLLSLLHELPDAFGIGVDLSLPALRVARANAGRLGLGDRAGFVQGHYLASLEGSFDLVVANPPYIASGEIGLLERAVRDHDPILALDGGFDGLRAYHAIAPSLGRVLNGGWCVLEVGAGQANDVADLLQNSGLMLQPERQAFWTDLGGNTRCVAAKSRGSG